MQIFCRVWEALHPKSSAQEKRRWSISSVDGWARSQETSLEGFIGILTGSLRFSLLGLGIVGGFAVGHKPHTLHPKHELPNPQALGLKPLNPQALNPWRSSGWLLGL